MLEQGVIDRNRSLQRLIDFIYVPPSIDLPGTMKQVRSKAAGSRIAIVSVDVWRFVAIAIIFCLMISGLSGTLHDHCDMSRPETVTPASLLQLGLYLLSGLCIVWSLYTKSVCYQPLTAITAVCIVQQITVKSNGVDNLCHAGALVSCGLAAILFSKADWDHQHTRSQSAVAEDHPLN